MFILTKLFTITNVNYNFINPVNSKINKKLNDL